jgi:hypothetical protein
VSDPQARLDARARAAELQERLGIAVYASDDGTHAIVDFDSLDKFAAELERVTATLRAHEIAMRQIRKERQTGYLLQRLDAILSEFNAALAGAARAAQEDE